MMKSPIRILAILIAATCLVNAHSQTEMKWFNADHSPTGARSSYVFGMKDRGGGFMVSKSTPPTRSVYMAYKSQATGAKILPFIHSRDYSGSDYYRDDEIVREFRFCSDHWETPHFSVTVYSPNWNMPDPAGMDTDQQRLTFCPAQWIEIYWDNSQNSYPAEILFGLQCPVSGSIGGEVDGNSVQGIHFKPYPQEEGYIVGLTGQADCDMEMVRYANVLEYFINGSGSDGTESGGLIFKIPPGSKDSLFVLTVHFTDDNATDGVNSVYYYRELFQNPEDVAEFAFPLARQVKRYCRQRDAKLLNSGVNPWRQFLIAHATHTYLANTMYIHSDIGDLWLVSEGDFRYLNTLDLTADMVFYELRMHPWTIRNILDTFSSRYFYYDQVRFHNNRRDRYPGGISFTHDMGRNSTMTAAGTSNYEYEYFMTNEELLNWILCAAMYWKYTDNDSWLNQNSQIFRDCLESMLNRDHHDESQRDGVPTMVTTYQKAAHEITTYDALDPGLKQPYENLYMAVKSWAAYVVLQHIFDHLGPPDNVSQAELQASRAAQTITDHQVNDTDGVWLKALFDQVNPVKIIPAVESLVFPYKMGDLDAVSENGRYEQLITALRQHLKTILTPGICIDPQTNVWKISSDTARTWQSKVYLCQYVAEHVFGMTGSSINGDVDEAHTRIQLNSVSGRYCWSEQIYSNSLEAVIGFHYPR
ncbi:hypothetical protein GF337_08275, partial [candidate division KSB1 bacterium]|nr:hypothetical protein [candidate division KSB1 bacterium]